MSVGADLVLVNGRVLTVDAAFTIAEALAVRAGRIVAVGSDTEIRPLIGPHTTVVDLAGRSALPGIDDSHLHACAFGATRPPLAVDVSHPAVGSITDLTAAVARHAATLPPDAWVIGNGWDVGYLADCRPTAQGAAGPRAPQWTIADLMDGVVGPERSACQWPVRGAVQAGIAVTASSDAPITYPDWRRGVSAMMLRESKATGSPSGPEQCVDLATALRAYTINAARQDFAEDWKGSLEVGKVADICVLAGDLTTASPHEIAELPVALTVFDGRIVYSA